MTTFFNQLFFSQLCNKVYIYRLSEEISVSSAVIFSVQEQQPCFPRQFTDAYRNPLTAPLVVFPVSPPILGIPYRQLLVAVPFRKRAGPTS